ncbi:heparan-alpha-glucosaminide N-acetyltransferase domain-containing protein [Kocuria sp. WRN011]|uniref:heparan-alpha-glucosaminide N-acetyltransferase domain-containing protein n=1 Tax=Kocuria sp. WRN011 TaxID=2029858 RepID=UPI0020B1074D|nr:heparan-alpha-glucosaminide N-acetyltransferase domain-containing protein [Kocuria sp. WRN011]
MSEQSAKVVVEGYLPPGHRPAPGPRPERQVWTGEGQDRAEPVTENELWTAQTPIITAPAPTPAPAPRQGAAIRNVPSADGRRTSRRIVGVDVARGFALLGMVAVHTLPATADAAGNPTWTWSLFGGNAAALFAVLAGVSLAFLTGGRNPRRGRDAARSRVSLVVRAMLLFGVGLSLNFLAIPAYNILIYYGLMFLLAIPFTMLSVRWLLVSAVTFAVGSPFLMQWSLDHIPAHVHANPDALDLVTEPTTVLAELFLTGTYPALPWMAFICLGMALGRMPLTRDRIQVLLVVIGAVVAAVGKGISLLMLYRFDLEYALIEATPWLTSEDVWTAQVYGPDPQLPTTTWQWLLLSGPHTNTPFALIGAAGLAMVALGAFLIASRAIGRWFTPLAAMGAMTLTLYAAHLVFLTFVDVSPMPWFWYLVQVAVAALVATAWQQALGSGPLERVVTRASKAAGLAVVRKPEDS